MEKKRDEEEAIKEIVTETKTTGRPRKHEAGVKVAGADNLLIRLSRCCNPVPGDEIIGFITKGRGVSVHRRDCPNMIANQDENRLIPVEWETNRNSRKEYNVDIEILGYDRHGLLNEVLQTVSGTRTNITAISGRTDRNKVATIMMTIAIHNISHLHKVVDKIKQIPDIYAVHRIMN